MSALWWIEVLFGIVVPIAIFLTPQARTHENLRFWTGLLVIGGVALGRFNVALFGFSDYLGALNVTYVPSFGEWMITLALIVAAVSAYIAAVKLLPILPQSSHTPAAEPAVIS